MSRTVLVTDGEQRASLAIVRSLGRADHVVHVVSARPRSLAGASRFAAAHWTVADPLSEPERYAKATADLIVGLGVDTLIPVSEPSLLALLPFRGELSNLCVPFVDVELFRDISDKALVTSRAAPLGIATPRQVVLDEPGGAADALRFPVVVKPSRSVAQAESRRVRGGVQFAADAAELQRILRALDPALFPVLVQERIVGPGIGVFLLVWDGALVASFAHRRIREKPPAGGVSVYRESVAAPADLLDRSRALLDAFGWRGVAMIEYKLDAATGVPYLMEINGRFWGSLQLAIDAGVDFPVLLLESALGLHPRPVNAWRTGVRSRWWWGDVDQLLARLRHSDAKLALPPGAGGRLAALRDFLVLWRPGDRNEILRASDPMPFVRESLDWFRGR